MTGRSVGRSTGRSGARLSALLSCVVFSRGSQLVMTLLLLGGFLGLLLGENGLAAAVVALAAAVAVGAAARAAGLVRPVPPHRIRTAIRDREHRTAFLPQRDPDASGRSRPRAPGRLVPTAA